MSFIQFWHHLFNPHCEICEADRECQSCHTLQAQLAIANYERQQLMNNLVVLTRPQEAAIKFTENESPEPIRPKNVPWHVRRQMLETEDRKTAELLRQKRMETDELKRQEEEKKKIEELEKELKLEEKK